MERADSQDLLQKYLDWLDETLESRLNGEVAEMPDELSNWFGRYREAVMAAAKRNSQGRNSQTQ